MSEQSTILYKALQEHGLLQHNGRNGANELSEGIKNLTAKLTKNQKANLDGVVGNMLWDIRNNSSALLRNRTNGDEAVLEDMQDKIEQYGISEGISAQEDTSMEEANSPGPPEDTVNEENLTSREDQPPESQPVIHDEDAVGSEEISIGRPQGMKTTTKDASLKYPSNKTILHEWGKYYDSLEIKGDELSTVVLFERRVKNTKDRLPLYGVHRRYPAGYCVELVTQGELGSAVVEEWNEKITDENRKYIDEPSTRKIPNKNEFGNVESWLFTAYQTPQLQQAGNRRVPINLSAVKGDKQDKIKLLPLSICRNLFSSKTTEDYVKGVCKRDGTYHLWNVIPRQTRYIEDECQRPNMESRYEKPQTRSMTYKQRPRNGNELGVDLDPDVSKASEAKFEARLLRVEENVRDLQIDIKQFHSSMKQVQEYMQQILHHLSSSQKV